MLRRVEDRIRRAENLRYRRGIERALALHLRGEVRNDGLKLRRLSTRLEIEWQARDVHPWDREDPPEKKAMRLVLQSLADTEAAIVRLFQNLPQVDIIALTVREHNSEKLIMTGTVHRSDPEPATGLSVGMRLWKRGVKYHSDGLVFEPLSSDGGLDVLVPGGVAG